jgi:hypothetical protein
VDATWVIYVVAGLEWVKGEVVAKSLAQSRPGTVSRFAVLIQSRERRSDDSSFADEQ